MMNSGQPFLDELAAFPADTFENRFSMVVGRLGVASALERNELTLLFEAAYRATMCNIALNGLGSKANGIRLEEERERSRLEYAFMVARDVLFASPGWQALAQADQVALSRIFLSVFVAPEKLAL